MAKKASRKQYAPEFKPWPVGISTTVVRRDAIWFGRSEPVPDHGLLAYRLSLDEYKGQQRVQMVVEAMLG